MASNEQYYDEEEAPVSDVKVPEDYYESKCFQCWTRACGRCWWILLAWCLLAWGVHAIAVAQPDPCFMEVLAASREDRPVDCTEEDIKAGREHWDLAPAFSKSLIWISMAHHTEPWQEHWRRSAPPPPPNFDRL